eukprot:TRINITY_DN19563_c0_g1_i1.p1 TRINITY_DN19563_c0_g1~~TRINITY_DN19563_c0_g1_i1.p1  ORF type:complete len:320 (-),score=91.95 TRINITY_DN19563_c0_g1_i1:24-983(-)
MEGSIKRRKTESGFVSAQDVPQKKKKPKKKSGKKKPIIFLPKSRKTATKIISEYHTLLKQLDHVKKEAGQNTPKSAQVGDDTDDADDGFNKPEHWTEIDESLAPDAKHKVAEIERSLKELGGIRTYQEASLFDYKSRNHSSCRWVTDKLTEAGLRPTGKRDRITLLDVGAIVNNYQPVKWIDCMAIDLQPRDTGVVKKDFFDLPADLRFNVIVLSLVVNFVPDARKRGEMLRRSHSMLTDAGHLFVILPLACLNNSRYLTHELFERMLAALGFAVVHKKDSKKLAFYMLRKQDLPTKPERFKVTSIVGGANRNNFCIKL